MLLHLYPYQYKSFKAFKRLIRMTFKHKKIRCGLQLESLYYLGSEHSFCKEHVNELLKDCQVEIVDSTINSHH